MLNGLGVHGYPKVKDWTIEIWQFFTWHLSQSIAFWIVIYHYMRDAIYLVWGKGIFSPYVKENVHTNIHISNSLSYDWKQLPPFQRQRASAISNLLPLRLIYMGWTRYRLKRISSFLFNITLIKDTADIFYSNMTQQTSLKYISKFVVLGSLYWCSDSMYGNVDS